MFSYSLHSVSRPRTLARERGAVAIIMALTIVVLVAFAGLALDLGKLYVAKTELQNSADACALAAARELTGVSAAQFALAESAGIETGIRNLVMFQSEPVALPENSAVTFSATLNAALPWQNKTAFVGYTPAQAATIKYVRCTVNRPGIANWFMQVLNILPGVAIGDQTVNATAVASTQGAQTNCALPVAICEEKLNDPDPLKRLKKGDWIAGALDPNGAQKGSFRWVDFGGKGGGAKQIKDIVAGSGACNMPAPSVPLDLKPGNNNGVNDAWNTRFGVYHGAYNGPADGVPDFTGFSYTPFSWMAQRDAYGDFQNKRNSNTPYQGDDATDLDTKGTPSSKAAHAAGADRRLNIVPVVNCAAFDANKVAPLKSWECMLMLHPIGNKKSASPVLSIPGEPPITGTKMYLEYVGHSTDDDTPCVTQGIPGGPNGAGPKVPVLVQ